MSDIPKIHAAMTAIMRGIDAIGKTRENKKQGFNFRGIDDAYNSLHDIMAKEGVFTIPRVLSSERSERPSKSGGILTFTLLTVEYDFMCDDGSKVTVGPIIGEGMDSGDKGTNKALAVAHKYALFQTFMIPTLFTDPDAETHNPEPEPELATEAQMLLLQDHAEAKTIPPKTLEWLEARKWKIREVQAAAILDKINENS